MNRAERLSADKVPVGDAKGGQGIIRKLVNRIRNMVKEREAHFSAEEREKRTQDYRNGMLAQALIHSDVDSTRRWLQEGGDPNHIYGGRTLLIWALRIQNREILGLLLEYHADPNKPDDHGKFPLDYTESDEIKDGLIGNSYRRLLVEYGASVSQKDVKQRIFSIFRSIFRKRR